MVYLSMLMALEDDRVFREALNRRKEEIGIEVFSFHYDDQEIKRLRIFLASFVGYPLSFHGPMRSAELSDHKGSLGIQKSMQAYHRALSLAQEWGGSQMVVHTHECHIRHEEKYDRMKWFEENIHDLASIAHNYGVQLSIENVSLPNKGLPLYNESEYVSLIKRTTECSALIDLGHVHCTGWHLEHLCYELSNRISGFHIHNNNGLEDQHMWIEDGTMDIDNALKTIWKYSKESDFILEYGDTEGKAADHLLRDVDMLRMKQMCEDK